MLAAGLVAGVLAGCGGPGATPTPSPASKATETAVPATMTPIPAAAVGEVVWTTAVEAVSNAPGGRVDQFDAGARTLFAVVRVTNLRAGSVLTAEWTYNATELDTTTSAVVPSRAYPAGFVQFHLSRDGEMPWPEGTYAITISLDGEVVQTASIDVVAG